VAGPDRYHYGPAMSNPSGFGSGSGFGSRSRLVLRGARPVKHDTDSFPRARRLDPERITRALAEQTGVRLTVEGPCAGGQVGTAYVRRPDGHRAVLKWRPGITLDELRRGPLAVADELRVRGYPAPATETAVQIGDDVIMVLQLLPGTKIDRFTRRHLDQVLTLLGSQVGALAERTDIPANNLHLRSDGPGFCLHEPLRQFSPRSARLERGVAQVGAGHPGQLPGVDAVHHDLHPGNILAVDGAITGVVDWDGAGRGDCRFDLVTLRFGIHGERADPDAVAAVDDLLDAVPEEILRPAWAHMSLRMTDWAIRHFPHDEVDHWLDLAEQRIP
jgi:Phosphotransferase enzyme family